MTRVLLLAQRGATALPPSGGLPALLPAVPAVDGDGDEHDLASGLAPQRGRCGGAEDVAQEDGQEQHVAGDADRPGPDLAAHAAEGAGEAKDVAQHFTKNQDRSAYGDLRFEEPSQRGPCVCRSFPQEPRWLRGYTTAQFCGALWAPQ